MFIFSEIVLATSANVTADDSNLSRIFNMHALSVGTVPRRCDGELAQIDHAALVNGYVLQWTVDDAHVTHCNASTRIECYSLHALKFQHKIIRKVMHFVFLLCVYIHIRLLLLDHWLRKIAVKI